MNLAAWTCFSTPANQIAGNLFLEVKPGTTLFPQPRGLPLFCFQNSLTISLLNLPGQNLSAPIQNGGFAMHQFSPLFLGFAFDLSPVTLYAIDIHNVLDGV
jgi:hypothetical protein